MNLVDELTGTLHDRAGDVAPAPDLAARALARGRTLRRRRRIATAVAPALAVVAVVAGTMLTTGGDRAAPPPPARTPTPTSGTTPTPDTLPIPPPTGLEPARPYARHPAERGARPGVHIGRWNVAMPPMTDPERLLRAGSGVVVELRTLSEGQVWFVGGDGRSWQLPGIAGAMAVSPSGTLMAARAVNPGSPRMNLVEIPSGETVATLAGDFVALAFAGGDDRVLFLRLGPEPEGDGTLGLWRPSDGSVQEVPDVAVPVGSVVEAAHDGRTVLIADEQVLRAVNLEGAVRWTRPGRYWEGPAMRFSPDGSRVALVDSGVLTIVAGDTGGVLGEATGFPFEAVGVTWADDEHVLVATRSETGSGYDDHRESCDVSRTPIRCDEYEPFDAILPG